MKNLSQIFILVFALSLFTFISHDVFAQGNQQTTTGDATSTTVVETQLNTNIKDCDCTPTPQPSVTPTPGQETPTPTPTTGAPTPTPTTTPGGGGNGGGPGDGRSDGGASAPSGPTQAVLGLSAAGSGNNMLIEFGQLLAALSLSILGLKLFKKHA
ncbi:MAG: hypothetical protein HY344_02200 [Candidatus Levybacteria bacterium]|nr:hypothetical protein [Candidatus Levybacteria bacterium]